MKQALPRALAFALISALLPTASQAEPATLDETVKALGRINGQALACGHKEVSTRTKTIVINGVPKTREYGEMFEQATTAAFLAQGNDKRACPPRPALTVELETVARPLAPPSTHQITGTEDAPDIGINPRYLLQATNGRAIMDGDFRDRFQLITFGYTFCPDICPTTLVEMAAILKQLGEQAHRLQPIFISVDPDRDNAKHLHEYLAFFDPRIIGATGSPELVKRAAQNFKVRYEKVIDPKSSPANYAMDHSAGMFLLAPGGQLITKFPYGMPVADILNRLNSELALRASPAAGSAPQQQQPQ